MWCPQSWVCEYFYIPVNGQIQLWTPFSRPEGLRLRELPLYLIHPCLCFDLQLNQVKRTHPPPPSPIPSVGSCRLQIHLCILACVMVREFSRKAVTKFLPAQFPWIWCKISSKKFNPFKDFQSDQIQRSSRKIFTTHYTCRKAEKNLTSVTGTTNGFIFQIINSLIESWGGGGVSLTCLDCNGKWNAANWKENVSKVWTR